MKGGHFLRDGDQNGKQFDAAFFNITRTEAETMDLQQRVVRKSMDSKRLAGHCESPTYADILVVAP